MLPPPRLSENRFSPVYDHTSSREEPRSCESGKGQATWHFCWPGLRGGSLVLLLDDRLSSILQIETGYTSHSLPNTKKTSGPWVFHCRTPHDHAGPGDPIHISSLAYRSGCQNICFGKGVIRSGCQNICFGKGVIRE